MHIWHCAITYEFSQNSQMPNVHECMTGHVMHIWHWIHNAIYAIYTMPIVRTMPFSSSHNAKCAHNAICASHTMPFMHTMPIVHTMPFMESTQCQLCAQCQICSTFGIVRVHIWHCVAAYLALCDVILYMHSMLVHGTLVHCNFALSPFLGYWIALYSTVYTYFYIFIKSKLNFYINALHIAMPMHNF